MIGHGKLEAVKTLERHGLVSAPMRTYPDPRQVSAQELRDDLGPVPAVVVRTAVQTEERNLPRLVGVDLDEATAWMRRLPSRLTALVQPYEQVLFSAELAIYDGMEAAEIIPGIWELDNRLAPLVLCSRGERVETTTAFPMTAQTARFHHLAHGAYQAPAQVDDYQCATVARWIHQHRAAFASLREELGGAFGIKVQYSAAFGVCPQNLRESVPEQQAWERPCGPHLNAVRVMTSAEDPIPTGVALLVDIAVAREEHDRLAQFIRRLCGSGVREVYLRSGMLSHLAINLREAGLAVRSAHE